MKIYHGVKHIKGPLPNPVVAIGVFDGVHRGHQHLIQKAVGLAQTLRGTSVVMTFDPHPVQVLRPENRLPQIISLDYRLQIIESLEVDIVVVVRFTKAFARLSPVRFIQNYLVKPLAPKKIIVGDDFRFGQNRLGTIDIFENAGKEFGFEVCSLKTKPRGVKKFSSTLVRDLIATGDLKKAAVILGRPVALFGKVRQGDRRGKTLGFPTANLIPHAEVLPPQGVYVVRVEHRGKIYSGMANVGVRPSFHQDEKMNVEVHLFNFQGNIYNQFITVQFLHKIRNEMYFPSSEALVKQLQSDEFFSRSWLARNK